MYMSDPKEPPLGGSRDQWGQKGNWFEKGAGCLVYVAF